MEDTQPVAPITDNYTDKVYSSLKDAYGDNFSKTPEEFNKLISTDNEYRNKVYSSLKDAYGENFSKTPEEFNTAIGEKKNPIAVVPPTTSEPSQNNSDGSQSGLRLGGEHGATGSWDGDIQENTPVDKGRQVIVNPKTLQVISDKSTKDLTDEAMTQSVLTNPAFDNPHHLQEYLQVIRSSGKLSPNEYKDLSTKAVKLAQNKERYKQAEQQAIQKKTPDNVYELARIQDELGLDKQAKNNFLNVAQNSKERAPEALYGLGYQSIKEGKYQDAFNALTESINQKPSEQAYNARGYANMQMGNDDAAMEDYQAARKINPLDVNAIQNISTLLLKQGKKDEAAKEHHYAQYISTINQSLPETQSGTEIEEGKKKQLNNNAYQAAAERANTSLQGKTFKEVEKDVSEGREGFAFINPLGTAVRVVKEQAQSAKDMQDQAETNFAKGKFFNSALSEIKGAMDLGFAGMSLLPEGAVFNVAIEGAKTVAPEEYQQALFAPISTIFKPESETGQNIAGILDVFASMAGMHGLGKLAEKVKTNKPLTHTEIEQAGELLKNSTVQDVAAATEQRQAEWEKQLPKPTVNDAVEHPIVTKANEPLPQTPEAPTNEEIIKSSKYLNEELSFWRNERDKTQDENDKNYAIKRIGAIISSPQEYLQKHNPGELKRINETPTPEPIKEAPEKVGEVVLPEATPEVAAKVTPEIEINNIEPIHTTEIKNTKDVGKVFNRLLKDELETEDYGIHGLLADWGAEYNPDNGKLTFEDTRSGTGKWGISKKGFINWILGGDAAKEIPSAKNYIDNVRQIILDEIKVNKPESATGGSAENKSNPTNGNQRKEGRKTNEAQVLKETPSKSTAETVEQKKAEFTKDETAKYEAENKTAVDAGFDHRQHLINASKKLAIEKSDLMDKLDKAKDILLGKRKKNYEENKNSTENFAQQLIDATLSVDKEKATVKTKLKKLGIEFIDTRTIDDRKHGRSIEQENMLRITTPHGKIEFPATSIHDIADIIKKQYPDKAEPTKRTEPVRLPKISIMGHWETATGTGHSLRLAEDNVIDTKNTIDKLTAKLKEPSLTKYDKETLPKELKGAKERLAIFEKQLEGAKAKSLEARNNYVYNDVRKNIDKFADLKEEADKASAKLSEQKELLRVGKKSKAKSAVEKVKAIEEEIQKLNKADTKAWEKYSDAISEFESDAYRKAKAKEFTELAKEEFENIKKSVDNGELTEQQVEKFSEGSAEQDEPIIQNLESKANSDSETELNEVVQTANELIGQAGGDSAGTGKPEGGQDGGEGDKTQKLTGLDLAKDAAQRLFAKAANIKNITPEEKSEAFDLIKQVADGLIQHGIKKGKELIEAIKKLIPTEYHNIVDENLHEFTDGEQKEHSFAKRIREDDELPPEFNQNFKDPYYTVIPNLRTVAEANKFIEKNGIEVAEKVVLNDDVTIPHEQRIALGLGMIDTYIKNKNYDKAIALADQLSRLGEKLGRGVQAFSLWKRIASTPEGALRIYQKTVEGVKKKMVYEHQHLIDGIKNKLNQVNKITAEKIINSLRNNNTLWDKYATGAAKKLSNLILGDAKEKPILQEFTDNLIKNLQQKIEERLPKTEKLKSTPTPAIEVIADAIKNKEKYRDVWNKTRDIFSEKYKDQPEVLAQLDEYFSGILDKPFSDKLVTKSIEQELKNQSITLDELIRKHYTEQDAVKQSITDKIIEQTGLSKTEAQQLSDAISKRFDELSKSEKERVINKMLSIPDKLNKQVKQFYHKVIELSNLGALSDEATLKAFSEKFDLPELDKDVVAKITDIANEIQSMPEGAEKNKKIVDLLSTIEKQKGISGKDIIMSTWYANILSSPSTHLLNAGSLTVNTPLVMAQEAIKGVRSFQDLSMMLKGLMNGYKTGAYKAADIMKTGYDVYGDSNLDFKPTHEMLKDSENKFLKILSNMKYVRRAMVAADMVFKGGFDEMKQTMIELNAAKETGLTGKALKDEVNNRLYNTESNITDAVSQAVSEGYKINTNAGKIRISEILNSKRNQETVSTGQQFGIENTLNGDPEGLLGNLASQINILTNKVPQAKFIVPFTRIVANATNLSLDYTPLGYKRAFLGHTPEGKLLGISEVLPEEKANRLIRATIGTVAMASVYVLAKQGTIELSGNGSGNADKDRQLMADGWRKNAIKIGDKWVSYQFTPLAIPFSIMGNILDAQKYKKLDEKSISDRIGFIMLGASQTVFNQSYLQGLVNFTDLFDTHNTGNAMKGFENWASKFSTSFVVPNLAKYIDKVFNPAITKTEDLKSYMLRELPVARELFSKTQINVLGEKVHDDATYMERFFGSFISQEKKNTVWDILKTKGIQVSVPNKSNEMINSLPMTGDQYDEFISKSGTLIKEQILLNKSVLLDTNTTKDNAQAFINSEAEKIRSKIKIEMGAKHLKKTYQNLEKYQRWQPH